MLTGDSSSDDGETGGGLDSTNVIYTCKKCDGKEFSHLELTKHREFHREQRKKNKAKK